MTTSTNKGTGEPKAARSAFVCFADQKKEELNISKKEILKTAASLWANLSAAERAHWDEVSREDKVRFVQEKAAYTGPLNVMKRRKKKDPSAPKRPMSAFLAYSRQKRQEIKAANPSIDNTDISRLLGEKWRTASPSEKEPFIQREKVERAQYKVEIEQFREEQAKKDAASRTSHRKAIQEAPIQQTYEGFDNKSWRNCVEPPVDGRIFRPSRAYGHLAESKPEKKAGRGFPAYYGDHPVPVRSQHGYQHHPAYYKQGWDKPRHSNAMMHPNHYHEFRPYPQPNHPQPENYNLQNPVQRNDSFGAQQPLKPADSDLSKLDIGQESFGDEPQFNPKQTRPTSSHYFSDSFYPYS